MITKDVETRAFEVVVYLKDSLGNPTNKKKSFATDSAYKLWEFWAKHAGGRNKKKKTEEAISGDEAANILKQMYAEDNKQKNSI